MDRVIYVLKADVRGMSKDDLALRVQVKLVVMGVIVGVTMIPFMQWTLSLCS